MTSSRSFIHRPPSSHRPSLGYHYCIHCQTGSHMVTAYINSPSQKSRTYIYIYINCLKLNLTYLRTPFLTHLFFHICRLVFLSWLQCVQCWCILFLFYLTVLIACMICFYYNVCDCHHAFIKGNLLTYLLTVTILPEFSQ